MTLTIELAPEVEARLHAAACREGLVPSAYAERLLEMNLPPLPPGQATRDLLRVWREEDATDNPEEMRKAEEELAEFKAAMNANRQAMGKRLLYP